MLVRIEQEGVVPNEDAILVQQNSGSVGVPRMPKWGSLPILRYLLDKGGRVGAYQRCTDEWYRSWRVILPVAPEFAIRGSLALVEDGDEIELTLAHNIVTLCVTEEELGSGEIGGIHWPSV